MEFKEKMKEEGRTVKEVDYVGEDKVREKVSCYTCDKCDTFFDRDYDVFWKEPVEVGDKIYCGDCYKEMKK